MDTASSIGVFDSGIGGLTVWTSLVSEMPGESMFYVADSGNAPYGNKSPEFILDRSRSITRFLEELGCRLIVVACNTATGAAISQLRKEFDIPFIGVEPALKPAAMESKTGHIGVLATDQTFKGEHFRRTLDLYGNTVDVQVRVGAGLVELVEAGKVDSLETQELLVQYLMPMVDKGIDQLVLGCTHYPFLIHVIERILPNHIRIIDPAPAVARQAKKVLEENGGLNSCSKKPEYRFFTTGNPGTLASVISQLTGELVQVAHISGQPLRLTGHSSEYHPA